MLSPLSYPELASFFSFQGLRKGANSHCLFIYFYFFFPFVHRLGLFQLQVLYHTSCCWAFTSAHLLTREKVLPELTLPRRGLSPPELPGSLWVDAAGGCIPSPSPPFLIYWLCPRRDACGGPGSGRAIFSCSWVFVAFPSPPTSESEPPPASMQPRSSTKPH